MAPLRSYHCGNDFGATSRLGKDTRKRTAIPSTCGNDYPVIQFSEWHSCHRESVTPLCPLSVSLHRPLWEDSNITTLGLRIQHTLHYIHIRFFQSSHARSLEYNTTQLPRKPSLTHSTSTSTSSASIASIYPLCSSNHTLASSVSKSLLASCRLLRTRS